MQKLLLPVLLLLPLASCGALLGVGAGVLISQEMLDNNTYVARLEIGAERLWTTSKATMSHLCLDPIDVDNDLRVAKGDVDQAQVTVAVETFDLNRSILKVSAKKYGVANGEIAKLVLDKILTDLEQ